MLRLVHVKEALRIFRNSRQIKRSGYKEYSGNYQEICTQVINDCWNGEFFQTSSGNFPQFWSRDFGWCVESLLKLGHKKKVQRTLTYALSRFAKHGKTATTITPGGKPFDFPTFSIDTLPYLFRAIKLSGFDVTLYKKFLQREIDRFHKLAIDSITGLVRSDKHFSSMKDYAKRSSSCYDNAMAASLQRDVQALGFDVPNYNYEQLILEHFWNGEYFYDDLTKKEYVAGDANVWPFWLDIIKDKDMLRKALFSLQKAGLDMPFPLAYTAQKTKMIWQEWFVSGYEQEAIWMHMGPLYVQLVATVNPDAAGKYKAAYSQLIEKHKNVLEVFNPEGKPFSTPFYQCDQGMLWAANFLTL